MIGQPKKARKLGVVFACHLQRMTLERQHCQIHINEWPRYVKVSSIMTKSIVFMLLFLFTNDLLAQLPIKTVTDVKYLGGGIADTFKGKIDGKKYVLKPLERIGDHSFIEGNFGQGNGEGEIVSLALLRKLGFMAPHAFIFRPAPQAPPILAISWVDENFVGAKPILAEYHLYTEKPEELNQSSFARMFAADVLIKNPDRHGRNFFIYKDSDCLYRPIPIDHNLALDPDKKSGTICPISLQDFSGLTMTGRLATLPNWGETVIQEFEAITQTIDVQYIDQIINDLPTVIDEQRKGYVRRFLKTRLNTLNEAACLWKSKWRPLPANIWLPGILQYTFMYDADDAASLCALLYSLIERDPVTKPHVSTFLNYNLSPLPYDVEKPLSDGLDVICQYLNVARDEVLRAQQQKVENIFRGLLAGKELLAREDRVSELQAFNVVWSCFFRVMNTGNMEPENFFTTLTQLGKNKEAPFGKITALRVAYVINREFAKESDEQFKRKLSLLRKLLKAHWQNILSAKEKAKTKMMATTILHSSFGHFLCKNYPNMKKSCINAAIQAALANFERKEFRVENGKVDPRLFAYVLRTMCVKSGKVLSWQDYWKTIIRFGDFSKNGPWLYGWQGPYTLADSRIGSEFMQYQGVNPHACARILFERLSWGPYQDWRGLLRRISPADVEGLVINPNCPIIPDPLDLNEAKFASPVTAPGGSFCATYKDGLMTLSVKIQGLLAMDVLTFPATPAESTYIVGKLSPKLKIKLQKLGLEEGSQVPMTWL